MVRVPTALFAAATLLSSFLLFQVQPLIAKLILPWFGGSAAVWTSCMLFFQMALLCGYGYAHWLIEQPWRRHTIIHLTLLSASLFSLPILPSIWWKPHHGEDPLLRISGLLTATVGLPYFLLSSTSPLLQSWYSRSNKNAIPYRLFALSNAGSMAGLLTYPILVEPHLTNRAQVWMWSIAYGTFAILCGAVSFRSRGKIQELARNETRVPPPRFGQKILWATLAASASALLLAVTNHVTQNVAPVPFLWVAPLSLYLLSFIVCFDSDRWYPRGLFTWLAALALPAMAYAMVNPSYFSSLKFAIGFFCAAVFVLFMVCHGELARRRPPSAYLTSFYLMVSLGGAIGGLLIGLAAPNLFNAVYDLPVIVVLTSFLFVYLLWSERPQRVAAQADSADSRGQAGDQLVLASWVGVLIVYASVRFITASHYGAHGFLKSPYDAPALFGWSASIAAYVVWQTGEARGRSNPFDGRLVRFALAAGVAVGLGSYLAKDARDSLRNTRVLVRNFYGSLQVYDSNTYGGQGPVRILRHGTIDHGEQFLRPDNQRRPTTYFTGQSGVGLAIHELQTDGPMRVGIIGLGTGTIAAYGRGEDYYRFYEINPLVVKVAAQQFTFLRGCPAPHDVILGDARLELEREPGQRFDILVVDAFSGDAIPVHLLTREAWALYWHHLKADGVLAVHVSNRYLDLAPVVALGAADDGKQAKIVSYVGNSIDEESASDWVLVTSRPGFLDRLTTQAQAIAHIPGLRPWTDDYSDIYKILR